jgi:drug/metabolite transporter (DMT)-like permease
MRIAAPEFGSVVLAQLRVTIAALFLLPIFLARANITELKTVWKTVTAIGALNSAIPFCLLSYAALHVSAGFASILNATSALWAALIAWIWLSEKLNGSRITGLILGFVGVIVLVWNKVKPDFDGVSLAILATIVASIFYGIGANYARKYMTGMSSLVIATGSMTAAAVFLLPGSVVLWPAGPISTQAWVAAIVMGIASTGFAYVLYFRLIANVGPAKAITVTYLVPVFAVLWGAVFIGEAATTTMIIGCAIILAGTALATGTLSIGRRRKGTPVIPGT